MLSLISRNIPKSFRKQTALMFVVLGVVLAILRVAASEHYFVGAATVCYGFVIGWFAGWLAKRRQASSGLRASAGKRNVAPKFPLTEFVLVKSGNMERTFTVARSILCASVAAAGVVAALAARADTTALNVKTGLWEMTVQMAGSPPLPKDMLERLPPEQRAKVDAMLEAMTQPHTTRTCLTKEKLARGPLEPEEKTRSCKRTVVTNSATALDVKLECPAEGGTASTSLHVEALSPQALKGTSVVTRANGGGTTGSIQGRWVADDCGDVK
jgi:hypothetical protein